MKKYGVKSMDIKVKATALSGGEIKGHFCMHEFIKNVSSLTADEMAAGTPIPPPVVEGGDTGATVEPTEYIVLREAVQTTGKGTMTVNNGTEDVELTVSKAVFTEIVQGSAKMFTGFVDKNGVEIYEGDKIRHQNSPTGYEDFTVVFKEGKFTVAPEWLWGCNFSPFETRKVQVIG